jgi:trehalose 6-phosphate phosphatase
MTGLPDDLIEALRKLAETPTLLVALDFDGTLAPEVDHPGGARALPESRAAVLRLLTLPGTRVAVVSGRAISSLEEVADLPGTALLVGSHGVEIRLGGRDTPVTLNEAERAQISLLGQVLSEIVGSVDHVWLEPKPAGFAIHTRRASDDDRRAAQRRALGEVASKVGDLKVRCGKNVLEFSVRPATKAHAIHQLREHTGASAVFFAGDDVTDEDAFAVLSAQDVGLKIGAGKTVAGFRVDAPADIAIVLSLLADLREVRVR